MTKKKPIIIAGPCSISSKKELFQTGKGICENIDFFRCGVWKARTNINSFEGIGDQGLPWISELQTRFNVPAAIEIGTPKHVEKALKENIKVFWLGARTTVNPFYVQEICNSLKGENVEVWVKNPIHPDMKLWISAFERLKKVGIKKLKAIHRGFFSLTEKIYRNDPKWNLISQLKNELVDLDIICDPSHISGNKKFLFNLSKEAIQKGYDGLMIETHCSPNNALSDAKQQITPKELHKIIAKLKNVH